MTIEEVRAAVDEIRKIGASDPEVAHLLEDKLFVSVLTFFSDHRRRIFDGELAYEALKSRQIDFDRWYV